ncbi:fimbrillin family protein [Butyricimonas faecalis]|uniref:Fimbrillin family protein n=1 Tax=Butyricimonas faecalis TaxID=2093856 RepID=A0A3S9VR26_9BACT|nr:fimbrillin family protein [Butyricimonas faecalis]AZS28984.1 fimbrillin family protein [Butyricimonas faecalis]
MKKIVTFFALALLAGVMVSCNNENSPMAQDEKVAVQFTGGINVSTRAAGVAWADGDKIGIFMTAAKETLSANSIKEGVDNVAYETNGGISFSPISGGKTIYYPIDGDVDFYAYYPQTTVNDYKVALNVADQSKQEAIDFMYAKTTGCNKAIPQVELKFSHQLSWLVLNVQAGNGLTEDDLENLKVTIEDQNTTATFNLVDGTISDEGNPNNITMKTVEAGKVYEAILLPTTSKTRKIVFDLNTGYDAPFVWTMESDLKGGNRYNYTTVKLTRTSVDIMGTIESWNEVKNINENVAL